MKNATDSDGWRLKYFDSLKRLETQQEDFRAAETALKRLVGRLCTASMGQSAQLDAQLKKLQTAARRDIDAPELDRLTASLTDAIQGLDDNSPREVLKPAPLDVRAPTKPIHSQHIADPEKIRDIVLALLAELRRDETLVNRTAALEHGLGASFDPAQLPSTLSSVAELVTARLSRLEHAKEEVEALLAHMVGKLDEIGRFVAEQHRTQHESQASSETLNVQLAGEIKAMGASVEATSDVQQIRSQVRSRIELIDQHLQAFRERESKLAASMQASNEKMRARIVELETRANQLNAQLKDEQRLATVDALTNIPNRLAYEQRSSEELERWKRFKQPTCLAVFDVDHFKRINDTYGHRAGDRVLRAVADRLSARIRRTDFLARYGGEEFVLLLPGTPLENAFGVLDDLRSAIANIGFHYRGTPIAVTVSAGVTVFIPNDTAARAFDRADKALYKAKQNGRNRVEKAE